MQTLTDLLPGTPAATRRNAAMPIAPSLPAAGGRPASECPVRIGLALGGGFARGITSTAILTTLGSGTALDVPQSEVADSQVFEDDVETITYLLVSKAR